MQHICGHSAGKKERRKKKEVLIRGHANSVFILFMWNYIMQIKYIYSKQLLVF